MAMAIHDEGRRWNAVSEDFHARDWAYFECGNMIVILEGIDGAGKSTIIQLVAEALRRKNVSSTLVDKHQISLGSVPEDRRVDCLRELIWGIDAPYGNLDGKREAYFKFLVIAAWYRLLADFVVQSTSREPGRVVLIDGWYTRHIVKTHLRTGISVDELHAIVRPLIPFADEELRVLVDTAPEIAVTRKEFSDHEVGYLDGFQGQPRCEAFIRYQSSIRKVLLEEFPEFRVVAEAHRRTATENADRVVALILDRMR